LLDECLVRKPWGCRKRTKREVVDLALREFVARSKQRDVLALVSAGTIAPITTSAALAGNAGKATAVDRSMPLCDRLVV
jgi:precorrin-6B methylase 2